jgi:pimeloyl-ACP methyl ester carboxylesterase
MIGYIILGIFLAYFLAMVVHAELFRRSVERKFPARGKFVSVDGIKLHYVEKGSGRPVVLLHGDAGSSYDFVLSPLLDKLAEKYRVLVFDRPGLGYSQRPSKDGWSPLVQARLIHGAVRQLGIEKPIVAGHSRGGATMFAWAMEYPDDMAAGVGLAPAFLPGSVSLYRFVDIPILSDFLFYFLMYPAERFGLTTITKQSMVIAFSPDRVPPPEYLDQYTSFMLLRRHMKSGMSDQANGGVLTGHIAEQYPNMRTLFVIVNGASDHNVPARWAKQAEKILPRARAIIIPNTGHELMFNQPDEVVRAVDLAWQMADER